MLNIGAHLSISKGFLSAAKEAVSIGGNTFAFFTRNPRGGKAKEIDTSDCQKAQEYMKEHNFAKLVAHAPYTLNLCSDKESTRKFAFDTLKDDLLRMEYMPGNLYNFHPGSHVGQGLETGIKTIIEQLNGCLFPEMQTTVLLETMAGKGSEVGSHFEELKEIIDGVSLSEKMGVCLDTCHIFDGGYDIVGNLEDVLSEFDKVIGIDKLKAIHINDSKNYLGCHKDRHEKIGEGSIGTKTFEKIINHKYLRDLPFILETPNELEGYKKEISLLRSLYK
ncbi:MAG: deoxyribonuclease IV [Acutalibacteraceae bacterium]